MWSRRLIMFKTRSIQNRFFRIGSDLSSNVDTFATFIITNSINWQIRRIDDYTDYAKCSSVYNTQRAKAYRYLLSFT